MEGRQRNDDEVDIDRGSVETLYHITLSLWLLDDIIPSIYGQDSYNLLARVIVCSWSRYEFKYHGVEQPKSWRARKQSIPFPCPQTAAPASAPSATETTVTLHLAGRFQEPVSKSMELITWTRLTRGLRIAMYQYVPLLD